MKKWIIFVLAVISTGLMFWSCSDDKSTEPDPEPDPFISVISPDSSIAWQTGTTQNITWTDNIAEKVKIELYRGGLLNLTISDSTLSSGSYIWTIPDTLIAGEDFKVKITGVIDTSLYDFSDVNFSLVEIFSPGLMVNVLGGTYIMGDHFSEGNDDELPLHSVTLNDFSIGKYEVTQAEWVQYMPSETYDYGTGGTYPVYYASWYEIIVYCNLRSAAEGLTPCFTIGGTTNTASWGTVPTVQSAVWDAVICNWNANGYRLPSESEWEYASRGGKHWNDNFHYSGSDTISDIAWYIDNSGNTSHSAGLKFPNQLGIYDMSGNEWEWCWDLYGAYPDTDQSNPYGAATGLNRVNRGGGWGFSAPYCRVTIRNNSNPAYGYHYIGFRVARTQ